MSEITVNERGEIVERDGIKVWIDNNGQEYPRPQNNWMQLAYIPNTTKNVFSGETTLMTFVGQRVEFFHNIDIGELEVSLYNFSENAWKHFTTIKLGDMDVEEAMFLVRRSIRAMFQITSLEVSNAEELAEIMTD